MSFHKEGDKVMRTFSVSKTLNKIVQLEENSIAALNGKPFGASMIEECIRYYDTYSLDTKREIILYTNGVKRDIQLNDSLFSYIVKGSESYTKTYGDIHRLEIQGCFPKDNEFSFSFRIQGDMKELPSIIYAMIILSETKNIDKAAYYWGIINRDYYMQTSTRLQLIMDGEIFFKKILENYPFMTQTVKDGLSFHIEKAKEEVQALKFLK